MKTETMIALAVVAFLMMQDRQKNGVLTDIQKAAVAAAVKAATEGILAKLKTATAKIEELQRKLEAEHPPRDSGDGPGGDW